MIGIVGLLAVLISPGQLSTLPTADHVTLSLLRQYGRSVFSQCRLDVVVYGSGGSAALWCGATAADGKGRPVPDLNARQDLTSDETKQVTETVRSARLFDGGHIRTDGRPGDGVFESLQLVQVVLVTSGNPTFGKDGSRKQLLSLLKDARMLTAHRALRRTFSQPPLRMSSPRATRGAIVALGVIVGMTGGAYVAEEMRENAWSYGLPIGAAFGGIVAYLVTK